MNNLPLYPIVFSLIGERCELTAENDRLRKENAQLRKRAEYDAKEIDYLKFREEVLSIEHMVLENAYRRQGNYGPEQFRGELSHE